MAQVKRDRDDKDVITRTEHRAEHASLLHKLTAQRSETMQVRKELTAAKNKAAEDMAKVQMELKELKQSEKRLMGILEVQEAVRKSERERSVALTVEK